MTLVITDGEFWWAGTPDAVDVLCLCLDVADNGGIGEDEEKQLKKIAQALQLPLDQYL